MDRLFVFVEDRSFLVGGVPFATGSSAGRRRRRGEAGREDARRNTQSGSGTQTKTATATATTTHSVQASPPVGKTRRQLSPLPANSARTPPSIAPRRHAPTTVVALSSREWR
jgi:hypothetical protein